jgi:hypothetical protein
MRTPRFFQILLIRISGFGLPSDFGLRISDLTRPRAERKDLAILPAFGMSCRMTGFHRGVGDYICHRPAK